jgi:glutamate/tyrosine decarboxylase-like PLP-dependent enzyme
MSSTDGVQASTGLGAPLRIDAGAFRRLGHQLIEDLADRLAAVPRGRVTVAERASDVRDTLGARNRLPETGTDPADLLRKATSLLFEHSLFNGHPKFFGYITSSPAPIGMLGDLLAAAVNANVGGWNLSPMATEIELQTVRWIAELIGYPVDCGGMMVSGGNMANMLGYFAARAAKTPWDVRTHGVAAKPVRLRVYASSETHTWVQKATDMSGLGTDAVRWIPTDAAQRMDVEALVRQIDEDRAQGDVPVMVVGTAGTVSTGAIDPLRAIARVCREGNIWFHVDGAYGGFAAALPDAPDDLTALAEADSVAVDPHKWLYAPLEVGCCLVRRPEALRAAFSFHPPYYHFDESVVNFFDYGPQNSRGFRALKVWLALQQAGARGYRAMMAHDIAMARLLCDLLKAHPEFEVHGTALSITTFRYVPPDLRNRTEERHVREYLDDLNRALLDASQRRGDVFVSNAVTAGRFLLRACLVNFNTRDSDIQAVPGLLAPLGRALDDQMRPPSFDGQ